MADPISRTFLHTSGGEKDTSWSYWFVSHNDTFIQVLENGNVAIVGSLGTEDVSGDDYWGATVLSRVTGEVIEFAGIDQTSAAYPGSSTPVGSAKSEMIMVAGKPGPNCVNPEDPRHIVWRNGRPVDRNDFYCVDLDNGCYSKASVLGVSDDSCWESVVLPTNWTTPLTLVDGCCHLYTDLNEYGFYYADFRNANWSTSGTAFTGGSGLNTNDDHRTACSADRLYIWHGNETTGDYLTEYDGITSNFVRRITQPHIKGTNNCQSTAAADCDFKFFPKRNELMMAGEAALDGCIAFYNPSLANDAIGAMTADGGNYDNNVRACEISATEFLWSFSDSGNDVIIADVDSGDSTDLAANIGGYQKFVLKDGAGNELSTTATAFDMESSADGKFVYILHRNRSTVNTGVIHKIAWEDWGTISINNNWIAISTVSAPTTVADFTISANSISATGQVAYTLPTATDSTEDGDTFLAEPTWEDTPKTFVY